MNILQPPIQAPVTPLSGTASQPYIDFFNSLYTAVNNTTSGATYVLNRANSTLTGAQVLANLASGFVKVTTINGILSSTGNTLIQTSDLSLTGIAANTYSINGINFFTVGQDGRLTSASSLTGVPPQGMASGELAGVYPYPTIDKVDEVEYSYFGGI